MKMSIFDIYYIISHKYYREAIDIRMPMFNSSHIFSETDEYFMQKSQATIIKGQFST